MAEPMTQNRRPGFRLPWTSDEDEASRADPSRTQPDAAEATADAPALASEETPPATATGTDPNAEAAGEPSADVPAEPASPVAPDPAWPTPAPAAGAPDAPAESSPSDSASTADADGTETSFLRDLVAAMRGVADEARRTTTVETQARAEAQVTQVETDSQHRRADLNAKAEADIASVGEWAKAEAERIRLEAEQRVAARRAQLEEQLAAEGHRAQAESRAVRDRLAEYERELDAYHAQLTEITDPAAFAAAAKRMPVPPSFGADTGDAVAAPASRQPTAASATPSSEAPPAPPAVDTATRPTGEAPPAAVSQEEPSPLSDAMARLLPPMEQNGGEPSADVAAPESLAQRLAALRADAAESAAAATGQEPQTTEVVVRGLGSFGAITGFRQALSGVAGVDGVSLSLGQSGEFVFRATHAPGFDMAAAIVQLEGEAATVESSPSGGLHVTLERAR